MMIFRWLDTAFRRVQLLDFLPLLAIRIYLLPIFYEGAHAKLTGFSALVQWFGAPAAQGGLNMPAPLLMATLATATETAGCICLALGLFTRLISIPLMVTMTVAGLSVHWSHGWAAIAGKTAESTLRFQAFMEWLAQNFPGRFNYITLPAPAITVPAGSDRSRSRRRKYQRRNSPSRSGAERVSC